MVKSLAVIFIFLVSNAVDARRIDTWFFQQKKRSLNYLLKNISRTDTPKGFIVASPSQSDPDYYFHWVRDAALVMRALDKTLEDNSYKKQLFDEYIQLEKHQQKLPTLTDLGEPKFNPNGTSFDGPWGRPQNDGPALRALTLIHYANDLLKKGDREYVESHLYRAELPANTVIKRDLEYISHHWREADFDLWEEVKGHHFYTRMVQRSALFLGAQLADKLNDPHAAKWYAKQASLLNESLEQFYSAKKGYILTTLKRVEGLDYKTSNLDASVILAVNHSWLPGLSFSPKDYRVQNTYQALTKTFKKLYPINHKKSGVAIGRYPEDRYYGGNPWFLLTNAMAEYLYKIDRPNEAGKFLQRVRSHMDQDGRMAEQFDKKSGHMKGARDLTWSYASFLTIR